ncbi:MAG: alginate lyase family protein [Pyrinomonadaceae bacterium]
MSVGTKAKPLDKIKKIRSIDEIVERGGQAISAYREQRLGINIPTDQELVRLVDHIQFGTSPIIAESLWQKFYKNGAERFFPSFHHHAPSTAAFIDLFGEATAQEIVEQAEKITQGRVNLLGFQDLYIGTDIDWHLEPLSLKWSSLKHWKEFNLVDSVETGDRKIVWELNRHQHFFTLGVAYWITRDEKYASSFAQQLDSWMTANPPGLGVNWSSSLEVALRAMSWLWAFHFFRDSDAFTPELFKKALKFLYLHGRHIEQYLSKYYSPNTHLTGEALGLYYLGTQLPFLKRAEVWRHQGEAILFDEITKQILADGVYFEQSTWYQRYTLDIFSHFTVLRSLTGEDNLDRDTVSYENRLESAFDFLMHLTLPDGSTPLIGDDDGGRMLPLTTADPDDFRGTLAVGAAIFDRGDHKYVAGGPSEELFWLMGPSIIESYRGIQAVEPHRSSQGFNDGGYYVMRDGWENTDNYLTVDCGPVGALSAGHGHADTLSIALAIRGKPLLVDSGTYTYHETKELRDHFRSTGAHNTLTIDGVSSSEPGDTFSWKSRADAECRSWIAEDRFDYFEGSHYGYQRLSEAAIHTRSILFLKNDYWIIRDTVETDGEHDYALNFHYDAATTPRMDESGAWVGDDVHRVYTFGGDGLWEQKESWISNNHGMKINAPLLRFVSRGVGVQEFFTFILPVENGVGGPTVTETFSPAGRAFVIKYGGFTDLFVINDSPGSSIATGMFDSNFKYSWARADQRQATPDEMVLISGSHLRIGDTDVFSRPDKNYAAIRRLGTELYIKTDEGRRKISLQAPH